MESETISHAIAIKIPDYVPPAAAITASYCLSSGKGLFVNLMLRFELQVKPVSTQYYFKKAWWTIPAHTPTESN